jgi:hypothetical protein
MKTPRQVLFDRHQHANHKLDALRRTALASLTSPAVSPLTPALSPSTREGEETGGRRRLVDLQREFIRRILSLRWHLAGMSAVWLVIIWLNSDATSASAPITAKKNSPSAREVLMALRENRRQILELLDANMAEPSPASQPVAPPRRSGLDSTNVVA